MPPQDNAGAPDGEKNASPLPLSPLFLPIKLTIHHLLPANDPMAVSMAAFNQMLQGLGLPPGSISQSQVQVGVGPYPGPGGGSYYSMSFGGGPGGVGGMQFPVAAFGPGQAPGQAHAAGQAQAPRPRQRAARTNATPSAPPGAGGGSTPAPSPNPNPTAQQPPRPTATRQQQAADAARALGLGSLPPWLLGAVGLPPGMTAGLPPGMTFDPSQGGEPFNPDSPPWLHSPSLASALVAYLDRVQQPLNSAQPVDGPDLGPGSDTMPLVSLPSQPTLLPYPYPPNLLSYPTLICTTHEEYE